MTAKGKTGKSVKTAPAKGAVAEPIGRLLCGRVRELRRKRDWTLEQMSAACGVSRSMISESSAAASTPRWPWPAASPRPSPCRWANWSICPA